MNDLKVTAVIPARYASTRFQGKPLVDILGKPMIQHVYERTQRSKLVENVLVATDDKRVFAAVKSFSGEVVMTSSKHETGTDRLAEVAVSLNSDIVVNVQGDEPLICPEMIDEAIYPLINDRGILMSTLRRAITDPREVDNPSVVKVVVDKNDYALYFSRYPIPFVRDFHAESVRVTHFKHIGLYVYDRKFLLKYAAMEPTPLEKVEKLEQLRVLENGYKIKVLTTEYDSRGVDTQDDLECVTNMMKKMVEKD